MNEKDFALIIKKKRANLRLTQHEAAALCNISDRTFQNVEYKINDDNTSTEISFSTYRKIAHAFGLKFTLQEKKRQRAKAKA